jgi:hypothetical protein
MHACHSKNVPEKASEKPDFGSAWLTASIEVDNAKAVLDLVWQSMSDNDWRDHLPEGLKVVATFADMHRFALDASISILGSVSAFFDENEVAARERRDDVAKTDDDDILHGKISDTFHRLLDEYKWALDAHEELCPTRDARDARFDSSKRVAKRFWAAEHRRLMAERALVDYKPANLAELRLKVRTIGNLRKSETLPFELVDDVLRSFEDFGTVANG